MVFSFEVEDVGAWYDGCRIKSHFLNALSAFLPAGEAFFIRAVSCAPLDRTLQSAAARDRDRFSLQEIAHQRHHEAYNAKVASQYPGFGRFVDYATKAIALVQTTSSRRMRLAYTVALEHVTAVTARAILSGTSPTVENEVLVLWAWHSMEELEHKTVAFDAYLATGGAAGRLRLAMALATVVFGLEFVLLMAGLLSADGLLFRRATWRRANELLGSIVMKNALAEYRAFYRAGFHPSSFNDAAALALWREAPAIRLRLARPPK